MAGIKKSQWAVDHHGIKGNSETGRYFIAIHRVPAITERHSGTFYDWPLHMAEKDWVDLPQFLEAFEKAIRLHAALTGKRIDLELLCASHIEAWRIWEKDRALAEIASRRAKPQGRLFLLSDAMHWQEEDERIYEEERGIQRWHLAMF